MNSLTLLVDATWRVSFILAIGLGVAAMLRHRSATIRHRVLAATVLCALMAPLLSHTGPSWHLPILEPRAPEPASQATGPVAQFEETAATARAFEMRPAVGEAPPVDRVGVAAVGLGWLWIAGVAVTLAQLAVGVARLRRITALGTDVSEGPWLDHVRSVSHARRLRRPIRVVATASSGLLNTWGVVRPVIVVPREAVTWPADRIRVVVEHEVAHIRRMDWLVQLGGELLRALWWFHPLVWVLVRRLRRESEQACDDAVLRAGLTGYQYAAHLLGLARELARTPSPVLPALTMARASGLEERISAMVNDRLDHSAGTRRARVAALLVMFGLSTAIATAQSGVAELSGTVFDATGRPVPGAAVVVQGDTLDSEMRALTGPGGRYLFEALPAGDYRLTVSLQGFKTHVVEGIALTGAPLEVDDVTLELGSLSEAVFIAGQRGIQTAAGVPRRKVVRPRFGDPEDCTSGEAGGVVKEPRKLTDIAPLYPLHLQAAGVGGVVILEGVVSTSGQVEGLKVLREVHPELDAAAIAAVRQWTYSPTLLNCEAVEVIVTVTMNFETR